MATKLIKDPGGVSVVVPRFVLYIKGDHTIAEVKAMVIKHITQSIKNAEPEETK